jgi:RNA polymerase sigma-70 factor (ECF subfamily)
MTTDHPPGSATEAPTVELVRRTQQGEAAAREALFARYGGRVLAIARARLGARLRANLESGDILQEALLEALRGLERFEMRDESSLVRWLAQLVEHRITARASYHDASKRDAPVVPLEGERGAGQPGALELAARQPGPATVIALREDSDAVQSALAELSERQRELVLLRDYAGASWEEVAKAVGAPSPAAARMLHARALARLGALLRARGL